MKMKKDVAIMFGGDSAEHEVSIITGLQVVENIDREKYNPLVIYMDQDSKFYLLEGLKSRKQFLKKKKSLISFGRDDKGVFVQRNRLISKKIYLEAAYLAFHGGSGEGGQLQGMFETLKLPFTSSSAESSILTMNKAISKDIFEKHNIPTVPGLTFMSDQMGSDIDVLSKDIIRELGLPVIVKPTHFGSSIGIQVAESEVELQKALSQNFMIDSEVLVEKFLKDFVEYNVAMRYIDGKLELSEIEKPIARDEILSFADKYERGGGKKTGDGMASLERELPADIARDLENKIVNIAKKAFKVCRCKGMLRIDFMVVDQEEFYVTEINSIPGSMSFYLWEASGITFKEQITDMLEQAIKDMQVSSSKKLEYNTDIVEKFVSRNE